MSEGVFGARELMRFRCRDCERDGECSVEGGILGFTYVCLCGLCFHGSNWRVGGGLHRVYVAAMFESALAMWSGGVCLLIVWVCWLFRGLR